MSKNKKNKKYIKMSRGYDLERIRTIMGHSSDIMLLRYYDAFRQNNSDNSDQKGH